MGVAIAAAALAGGTAIAQTAGSSAHNMHSMHDMQNMSPAHGQLMAAMKKMDQAMMQGMMDRDPGQAWLKSMAAHHQGAIDMSQIIQRHTKDAAVLREARKTITDNTKALADVRAKIRR